MELLEGIYSRRSQRRFTAETVPAGQLREIVRAGTWAPSGLNNQPWRFVIVTDAALRSRMAAMTKYSRIVTEAPACIAVFVDREAVYHEVKDHQAVGACLQNMLLAAHALGLGAVWLGEILKSAAQVRDLLELPGTLDLMAVVAVGHPSEWRKESHRRDISEVILREV